MNIVYIIRIMYSCSFNFMVKVILIIIFVDYKFEVDNGKLIVVVSF